MPRDTLSGMPLTPEQIDAIKAAAVAALTSPTTLVRDGDQHVEMRRPHEVAEALAMCAELEDAAAGRVTGHVVLCPGPVTL